MIELQTASCMLSTEIDKYSDEKHAVKHRGKCVHSYNEIKKEFDELSATVSALQGPSRKLRARISDADSEGP